ncbi:hypothetical protein AAVH_09270 [Aphelenchoides avenae]|nr:hypothetical protein AAVH_09270 [Aphelenchus avenae]
MEHQAAVVEAAMEKLKAFEGFLRPSEGNLFANVLATYKYHFTSNSLADVIRPAAVGENSELGSAVDAFAQFVLDDLSSQLSIVAKNKGLALESFATGEPHNVSIAQEDVIGNVKILAELNKLRDIESLWKQVDDTVPDTAKETLPSADGAEKSQEPQESAEAVSSEAAKEHSEHVTDAAEAEQKEEPVLAESTEPPAVSSEKNEEDTRAEETHHEVDTELQEAASAEATAAEANEEIPAEVGEQNTESDSKGPELNDETEKKVDGPADEKNDDDGTNAAKDGENSHDSGAEDMEYPAKPKTRADQIAQLYRAFIDLCIQLPQYDSIRKLAEAEGLLPAEAVSRGKHREDGVLIAEQTLSEEDRLKQYASGIKELFDQMENRKFRLDKLQHFTETIPENFSVDTELWKEATDRLIVASKEVDIRVKKLYLPLLRRLFLRVEDVDEAMRYFLSQEYFKTVNGGVPNYHSLYAEYDEVYTNVVNHIPSMNDLSDQVLDRLSRELGFLLLVAPKPTIRLVLLFCLEAGPLVPSIAKILRRLPAFNEFRVYAWGKPPRNELLYITLFRRLFNTQGEARNIRLDTSDGAQRVEYLLSNLSKTRLKETRPEEPRTVLEGPVVDATELVRDFVMDHLLMKIQVKFFSSFLCKIFTQNKTSEWVIRWKQADDEDNTGSVDPCFLLATMVDLFVTLRNESDHADEVALMPKAFKALAAKLKAEGVSLAEPELILNKMNEADWTLKYSLTTWLQDIIQTNVKLEIPFTLYESLKENKRFQFAPIFRRANILHLALTDADLALKLFEDGISRKPHQPTVVLELAHALLVVAQRQNASQSKIADAHAFFDRLLTLLDAPVKDIAIHAWTDASFQLSRRLLPTMVYSDAIRTSLVDDKTSGRGRLTGIAKALMEAFCTHAMDFVRKCVDPAIKDLKPFDSSEDLSSKTETEVLAAMNILHYLAFVVKSIVSRLASPPLNLLLLEKEVAQRALRVSKALIGALDTLAAGADEAAAAVVPQAEARPHASSTVAKQPTTASDRLPKDGFERSEDKKKPKRNNKKPDRRRRDRATPVDDQEDSRAMSPEPEAPNGRQAADAPHTKQESSEPEMSVARAVTNPIPEKKAADVHAVKPSIPASEFEPNGSAPSKPQDVDAWDSGAVADANEAATKKPDSSDPWSDGPVAEVWAPNNTVSQASDAWADNEGNKPAGSEWDADAKENRPSSETSSFNVNAKPFNIRGDVPSNQPDRHTSNGQQVFDRGHFGKFAAPVEPSSTGFGGARGGRRTGFGGGGASFAARETAEQGRDVAWSEHSDGRPPNNERSGGFRTSTSEHGRPARQCFTCGSNDHLARDCPDVKHGGPANHGGPRYGGGRGEGAGSTFGNRQGPPPNRPPPAFNGQRRGGYGDSSGGPPDTFTRAPAHSGSRFDNRGSHGGRGGDFQHGHPRFGGGGTEPPRGVRHAFNRAYEQAPPDAAPVANASTGWGEDAASGSW